MDAPTPITAATPEEIKRFNLVCALLALAWVFATLFLSVRYNKPAPLEKFEQEFGEVHEYHDFSQFYMGGLIARYRVWDALYPIPHKESVNSPGEWEEADSRPAYAQLAKENKVPEHQSRFIQPPPFAVMMQPLAYLPYARAKQVWNVLMCLCAWGVALMAGRTLRAAWGRPTRAAGVVTLLVAVSPLTFETLRLMNVTPLISLLCGWAVVSLLSPRSEGGAIAVVIGAVSKYATAILIPLYLAMRRGTAVIVMILAAAAIVGGTYYYTGRVPFDTFWHEMLPTFNRVHTDEWNRSFFAILRAATTHDPKAPLTGGALWAGRAVQGLSLLAILWVLFTRPVEQWRRPASVFAGAAALLGWFLIFSPILWDHYLFYLAPLWGWLVWEARLSLWRAILVIFAIGWQSLPGSLTERGIISDVLTALGRHHVPAPESLITLLTVVTIVAIAIARLTAVVPEVAEVDEDADEYDLPPATFIPARHFNLACYAIAAIFLALFAVHHMRGNRDAAGNPKQAGDFPQFYMGGVMARLRAWDDLYPVPKPTSINNAGMPSDSDMRPRYAAEAQARGVGDQLRFIQPPPVALMLLPLGYLSYAKAYLVWITLLAIGGWLLAYVSGQVYRELFGRETRVSGAIAVLIACSPLMLHAIDVANMTIFVGLLIGIATLELIRRREVTSALAITVGALLKYATLALLPLAVAMRRWTLVVLTVVFAGLLVGGTFALTKQGPFQTYARDIAPTLGRTHTITTNQSVAGVLMRARSSDPMNESTLKPLPPGIAWGIRAAQALTFLALLWLMFRRPVTYWDEPAHVLAAAAALVCWLLVFSPIYWEHYPVYLAPTWAWLIWEARRSKAFLILAVGAIALMWVPWTAYDPEDIGGFRIHEPFNSHILAGTLLAWAAAIVRLCGRAEDEGLPDDERFEVATPFEAANG